jgi:hypothetical protein
MKTMARFDTLAEMNADPRPTKDLLEEWLTQRFQTGDLFTYYQVADELKAWRHPDHPGVEMDKSAEALDERGWHIATIAMAMYNLAREGRLWCWYDVELIGNDGRYVRWSLPVASGVRPQPQCWSMKR